MGDIYEVLCVTAIAAWVFSRPLRWVLTPQLGALAGLGIALLLSGVAIFWPASAWPVALFSPVSLGVAGFALVDLARPYGVFAPRWSVGELGAILLGYIAYLYASLGGVPFDPYALGYGGGELVGVPVILAGYAYWRRDWVLGAIIAASQALWLSGIGSENYFDHLASVLIIPAILIGLTRRFTGR